MPLTPFQKEVSKLLGVNRSPDSYLAGGAALHFSPNSRRYSNDLDYFHDSVERVAQAFQADRLLLEKNALRLEIEVNQPGYIRAVVSRVEESTKIEWAHDSAWRFLPPVRLEGAGYMLHPVDLALNKLLALAGRDEARDFLDILIIHEEILALGALVWAAVGKDPGFTPLSLLELLKRRGKNRPEEFKRLRLARPIDPPELKTRWLAALEEADRFVRERPAAEAGCLYYSPSLRRFTSPGGAADAAPHYGAPGGVLPRLYTGDSIVEELESALKDIRDRR